MKTFTQIHPIFIERAQKGDEASFNRIVSEYKDGLYRFIRRLSRSDDIAADIVVETFVRAYLHLPSFKGDAEFSTWLFRIAFRLYADECRRAKRLKTVNLGQQIACGYSFVSDGMLPDECCEISEENGKIVTAVRALPELQREIITLFHLHHLSYQEISDRTGLPLGTVKSRLNRARLMLSQSLGLELSSIAA